MSHVRTAIRNRYRALDRKTGGRLPGGPTPSQVRESNNRPSPSPANNSGGGFVGPIQPSPANNSGGGFVGPIQPAGRNPSPSRSTPSRSSTGASTPERSNSTPSRPAPSTFARPTTFRDNASRFGTALLAAAPIPFYEGDDRARERVREDLASRRRDSNTTGQKFLIGTADFLIPATQAEAAFNIASEALIGPVFKLGGKVLKGAGRFIPKRGLSLGDEVASGFNRGLRSFGDDVARVGGRGADDVARGGGRAAREAPRAPRGTPSGKANRKGRFKPRKTAPSPYRGPLALGAGFGALGAFSFDSPLAPALRPDVYSPSPDGPGNPGDQPQQEPVVYQEGDTYYFGESGPGNPGGFSEGSGAGEGVDLVGVAAGAAFAILGLFVLGATGSKGGRA